MSFTDQLNQASNQQGVDYNKNIEALQALEAAGHKVEAKGTQAAYIDDRLMIFLYMNSFEDHVTGKRGDIVPGEIAALLEDGPSK